METVLLRDLSVVMVVAAATTLICHVLRQPVVIGYLLAGLIIGPHTPPFTFIQDLRSIHTMAELGLVFLMFALGLEFSLPKLRRVGASAALAAALEIGAMLWLGFVLGKAFGWSRIDSIYLGAILSISSTTIIVKVFSDLKLLKEDFAQVVFGILILEDILAIVILTLLSGLGVRHASEGLTVVRALTQVGFFVILFLVLGLATVPRLIHWVGRLHSRELLGIIVLGLCLAGALLAHHFGFSVALGAFLIGSIIGVSHEIDSIEEWIHPIRDMFSAIFFVSAGLLIDPQILWMYKGPILIVTLVTILGKTLMGAVGSYLAGYPLKISFKVGMSLAQIGEFSFVFAAIGLKTRMASEILYPLAVAVSAVTTLCTPYLIRSSDGVVDALLRFGGRRLTGTLDRYHEWLSGVKASGKEGSSIVSKYLWRLVVYAALFMAALLAAEFAAPALENKKTQAAFWMIAFAGCVPLMLGVARYVNHFLLLLLTELMVRFRANRILQWLPIHRAYNAMETFLMTLLSLILIWRAHTYFSNPTLLWTSLGATAIGTWLLRRFFRSLYTRIEGLLDDAMGLASSEPLRRAALVAEGPQAVLSASMDRVLLTARSHASHQTLRNLNLREKSGASLIAVYRGGKLLPNPSPDTVLLPNDILVVLGDAPERDKARRLLS